ncbi:amino acid permease [Sporomusa sphaeroides]|uniref:amino acid permease n=1 Tax=Sporomusa sphaeroides TaxID=47679 RepID=UPI002C628828|nr:amino acid permease [Sporomusa sphaeroides]HML32758.1 amino acid permease [Sporomusa sphaeroides]
MSEHSQTEGLHRGLKNRHIQLIALGGAIGTGLFYGSTKAIQIAGPSVMLSYLIGGIIIFWIMRHMGEMLVDEPVSGSFSHFAYKYWGDFPGFLSGWNYWMAYVLVNMAELTVVGKYIQFWWPDIPVWVTALVCWAFLTVVNLINVKLYGEFEFWFAIIKVVAIIGMIVFGTLILLKGDAGSASGVGNLWNHGGFFANGLEGFLCSLAIVMFAYGGTEMVGVAAGEADNPKKTIPKAINQVMWRILIFYVGALLVILMIYPWNQLGVGGAEGSPFVQIFSKIGISSAAALLNVVVITAALSAYNSGLYTNGRMLYNLAHQGNAPAIFKKLNKAQIPVAGVLFSSFLMGLVVFLNYLIESQVFVYLMALVVSADIISWVMISISHMKFRQAKSAQGEKTDFPAVWYPVTNYICMGFLAMVFALMGYMGGDWRISLYLTPIWLIVLYLGYKCKPQASEGSKAITK